jgi:GT2 family glycosyltransferase
MISIIVVTCNRLHLLRQCVENVLNRASSETKEIIFWDNASSDGTHEFLKSLQDSRIRLARSDTNIAVNAYSKAVPLSSGDFLIELDDDVIDAPHSWDVSLLEAYRKIPKMGYLAADIIDDGKSIASDLRYRIEPHRYTQRTENGVRLIDGPVGGYCTITSRAVYDEVGGFAYNKNRHFWNEDGEYITALYRAGYAAAVLADLKVFHASGPAYSYHPEVEAMKNEFFQHNKKWIGRRKAVRSIIDRIPFVNRAYARLRPQWWGGDLKSLKQ